MQIKSVNNIIQNRTHLFYQIHISETSTNLDYKLHSNDLHQNHSIETCKLGYGNTLNRQLHSLAYCECTRVYFKYLASYI